MRVLLAENNPATGRALAVLMRAWGWDAEWAISGESAAVKARAMEPDVVLFDHFLGDLDGVTLVRRLRAQGNAGAMIAFTAADDGEVARLEAEGVRVVRKPADAAELRELIEGAAREHDPAARPPAPAAPVRPGAYPA